MDGRHGFLAGRQQGCRCDGGSPSALPGVVHRRKPEGLHVLAQNVSAEGFGAHTGEYTADMLKSCHVAGAIVGHSERRARFGDEDAVVASKVDALIAAGLLAVFCCGETLQEREGEGQKMLYFNNCRPQCCVCLSIKSQTSSWRMSQFGPLALVSRLHRSKLKTCIDAFEAGWPRRLGKKLRRASLCFTAGPASQEMQLSCFLNPTLTVV